MGKHLYALLPYATYSWLLNKFLELPRPELSFAAKIAELHQDNVRLARDIRKWECEAAIESERRQTAELEASRLRVTIRQLHMDNEKLEKHISEWKSIAEESKSEAVKYCREMSKVFIVLEEVMSELPSTCTE